MYSADGELLFAGMSQIADWAAAHGDHGYRIETDAGTQEQLVVRSRILAPF